MTRWLLPVIAMLGACQRKEPASEPAPQASASVSAAVSVPPVDRLAPGELAPGTSAVFGFEVPRQMEIKSRGIDRALLEGDVQADALVIYVRDRVVVSHVEIGAGRTVFPQAKIKDGPEERVYQLEVVPSRRRTQLLIEDVTRPPDPGPLTNEERWRRAGRGPDGKPLTKDELQ